MFRLLRLALCCALIGAWVGARTVAAQPERSADLTEEIASAGCVALADPVERLACYDKASEALALSERASYLERQWDLAGESRLFQPWAHHPTYVLPGRWTDDVNTAPFDEAAANAELSNPKVQSIEAKFQISFKTQLWREMFGGPGNLWFGYTQQSHFQVYNKRESRPFRETDFKPELIAAFPLRRKWGAWTWRMIGVGLVHQSNGRSEPLSRSWNRISGTVAGERGDLSMHLRGWVRFDSDDPQDDDNPDIAEFIGRAEAEFNWTAGRHVLMVRLRSSLEPDHHRGSVEANWFYPLRDRLRGQLQVFTGYGESLIDFDHRQTAVGVGFLLFDPF